MVVDVGFVDGMIAAITPIELATSDRKSTRLNSSHTVSSYAVCADAPPHLHPFPTRRSSDLPCALGGFCNDAARFPDRTHSRRMRTEDDRVSSLQRDQRFINGCRCRIRRWNDRCDHSNRTRNLRSEEHTSELQSHSELVCRLRRRPAASPPLPYTTLFRSPLRARRLLQ